jgi:hypothetical protein
MPEASEIATNHYSSAIRGSREVQDVTEPNLLREMFPYHAVPRIVFDGAAEPLDPAPEFLITDTTFRDGQQARPPIRPARSWTCSRCCIGWADRAA